MAAFASIHTKRPLSQSDGEGVYGGYKRIPIEEQIGVPLFRILFPEIEKDTDMVMTHIAIGAEEEGDGEVFMSFSCDPHIPLRIMQKGKAPNIAIYYPPELQKYAQVVHQLVLLGRIRPDELDPKFFMDINDSLQAHGIPILTVVRGSSARWNGKMSNMPSLGAA